MLRRFRLRPMRLRQPVWKTNVKFYASVSVFILLWAVHFVFNLTFKLVYIHSNVSGHTYCPALPDLLSLSYLASSSRALVKFQRNLTFVLQMGCFRRIARTRNLPNFNQVNCMYVSLVKSGAKSQYKISTFNIIAVLNIIENMIFVGRM